MIGADHSVSDLINKTGLVDRHKGKSSVDDLTVNESSDPDPDPDPDPDSVPFPKENHQDQKRPATRGEPMHICQGIMTHLTNETVETVEESNEDTIIDIDEDNTGNNANNNTNEHANEDDESTGGPMMSQVD